MSSREDSPFGINTHVPTTAQVDLIAQAGIKWIRVDFDWPKIEPKNGKFQFDEFRRVAREAKERGLMVFGTLSKTPAWANGGKEERFPPLKPEYWTRFVARTVSEFKSDVTYWGIWNEPNLREKEWAGSVSDYVSLLLKPATGAAKNANPECRIVAPDIICNSGARWWEWIRGISKMEAHKCIDVFSCHIYKERESEGPPSVFAALDTGPWYVPDILQALLPDRRKPVRRVLREARWPSMPLWLTEVGWHTPPASEGYPVSEKTQAKFYSEFCTEMVRRRSPDRVFFYELLDQPQHGHNWGILRPDDSRKPSYFAYQEAIKPSDVAVLEGEQTA